MGFAREHALVGTLCLARLLALVICAEGADLRAWCSVVVGGALALLAYGRTKEFLGRKDAPARGVDADLSRPAAELEAVAAEDVSHCSSCPICLHEASGCEAERAACCGATFHGPCIRQWLRVSPTCPSCRAGLRSTGMAAPAPRFTGFCLEPAPAFEPPPPVAVGALTAFGVLAVACGSGAAGSASVGVALLAAPALLGVAAVAAVGAAAVGC